MSKNIGKESEGLGSMYMFGRPLSHEKHFQGKSSIGLASKSMDNTTPYSLVYHVSDVRHHQQ